MAESDDRRGVFVSWSKEPSAVIARLLQPFLEDVLGTATIFMSQSMDAGTRWSMEIPQRLQDCNAGLIIVTPGNCREPWLHFEAGALSKQIDESRVIPLLCASATVGDVQGTPLSLFQSRTLDHDGLLSVCVLFGTAFGISEETVRRRFEKSWSDLDTAVAKVAKASTPAARTLELPDLMAVLERISAQVTSIEGAVRPSAVAGGARSAGGMFGAPVNASNPKLSDLLPTFNDAMLDPETRLVVDQLVKASQRRGVTVAKGLPRTEKKTDEND
jgi:hypothetical protein